MAPLIDIEIFQGTLVVHPETLRQKSRTVLLRLREMKNAFEMLEKAVGRTRSYWAGEAGTLCRSYVTNRIPEAEEMFLRLMEHVEELNHMAAVYVKAEQESEEIAEALPANVIR